MFLAFGAYLALDEGYSSRKKTEHHNGMLVDGAGFVNEDRYHVYENLGEEFTASILTTTLSDGWVHAVSETSAMYDRSLGVERLRRHLVMTPSGALIIVDDVRAASPREWTWLLQTEHPAVPDGDARWRADAGPGFMLVTAFDDDTTVTVSPTLVQANPTSSTPSLAIEKVQHTMRRVSPRSASGAS